MNLSEKMKQKSINVINQKNEKEKIEKENERQKLQKIANQDYERDKQVALNLIEGSASFGSRSCLITNFNELNQAKLINFLITEGFKAHNDDWYHHEDHTNYESRISVSW